MPFKFRFSKILISNFGFGFKRVYFLTDIFTGVFCYLNLFRLFILFVFKSLLVDMLINYTAILFYVNFSMFFSI